MADKTLQSLVGGSGIKFAPDLTFPSSLRTNEAYKIVEGIDATGGLTTILSLSGKFIIDYLLLSGASTLDSTKIRATLDGELLWDDVKTGSTSIYLLNSTVSMSPTICEESFTLEIQTNTDTDIDFGYLVRPIL